MAAKLLHIALQWQVAGGKWQVGLASVSIVMQFVARKVALQSLTAMHFSWLHLREEQGRGGRGEGACNLELFNCHARLIWQHIMQLQLQQVLPNEANQSLSDKQLREEKKKGEESDKETKEQKVKMEKQQQRQQRSCHAKPATFDQHFVLGSIWIYQSVTCDKDERKYNSKGVKERGLEGEGVCIYKGRITERGGWHVQE